MGSFNNLAPGCPCGCGGGTPCLCDGLEPSTVYVHNPPFIGHPSGSVDVLTYGPSPAGITWPYLPPPANSWSGSSSLFPGNTLVFYCEPQIVDYTLLRFTGAGAFVNVYSHTKPITCVPFFYGDFAFGSAPSHLNDTP